MKTKLFFLLLLTGTVSVISAQNHCSGLSPDTTYSTISATLSNDTINTYKDKNWFVILDVRTPGEYNGSHIHEAVNLDYYSSSFATQLALLNRGKVYMIYCASGSRSGQVFLQMQNLGFRRVYNMSGGLGAWNTGGFPTTTSVAPIPDVCDTNAVFANTAVGNTDSLEVILTNAANATLSITSFTDLSGTVFSTGINPSVTLAGGRDYSFMFYYTPDDTQADSAEFILSTNGGDLAFRLYGMPDQSTLIATGMSAQTIPLHNPYDRSFRMEDRETAVNRMELYDVRGVKRAECTRQNELHYPQGLSGLVILRVEDGNGIHSYKFALVP